MKRLLFLMLTLSASLQAVIINNQTGQKLKVEAGQYLNYTINPADTLKKDLNQPKITYKDRLFEFKRKDLEGKVLRFWEGLAFKDGVVYKTITASINEKDVQVEYFNYE